MRLSLLRMLAGLILAAVPLAAEAGAPSFDCSRAGTRAERLICSNDGLAALDRQLADDFKKLRERTPDDQKAGQLKEQRDWLRDVRDRCAASAGKEPTGPEVAASVACLSARHRVRISELAEAAAVPPEQNPAPYWFEMPAESIADPRLTLVRIQSALERIAAGKPSSGPRTGEKPDPLAEIAAAYRAFLDGDPRAMDAVLEGLRAPLDQRTAPLMAAHEKYEQRWTENLRAHVSELAAAAGSSEPLTRLVAALRHVDSVLFLETLKPMEAYADPRRRYVSRGLSYADHRIEGTWLKLPCRTLAGRASAFAATRQHLGDAAGQLLACPADTTDFTALEALARNPTLLDAREPATAPTPERPVAASPVPTPPWDHETAVAHMGDQPDLAQPVLEAGSHRDAMGKLDYALFLYAFRPDSARRNKQITTLLNEVLRVPADEPGRPPPFSRTDRVDPARLIEILRYASLSQIADPRSAFYVIPCAALLARPGLLEAIEPYYGSSKDNFLPRSGCDWGRGKLDGFPEQAIRSFMGTSEDADGHFIDNYDGTMKYGKIKKKEAILQTIAVNPREFLKQPSPTMEYPYQTWGATGLSSYHTGQQIRSTYREAFSKLVAYCTKRGMNRRDAERAARTALFQLVYGAECGTAGPGDSTRQSIMAGAAASEVIPRLAMPNEGESWAVLACANDADLDPLPHVAIVDPVLLEHLLIRGDDVDTPNGFGKTPLMVAAQYDRTDSARILLAHGAAVNAATWQGADSMALTLYHDARSALMYAAANASLPMIRLLLRAGADPYQADSKGRRAIDYLLGFGPTATNPRLTPAEREEAVRLLY